MIPQTEEEYNDRDDMFNESWSKIGFEYVVKEAIGNLYEELCEIRQMLKEIVRIVQEGDNEEDTTPVT